MLIDFPGSMVLWSSDYAHEPTLCAPPASTEWLRQLGACYSHFLADSADFFTESYRTARTSCGRSQVAEIMRQFTEAGAMFNAAEEAFVFPAQSRQPTSEVGSILAMFGVQQLPPIPEQLTAFTFVAVPRGWAVTSVDPDDPARSKTIRSFLTRNGWSVRPVAV